MIDKEIVLIGHSGYFFGCILSGTELGHTIIGCHYPIWKEINCNMFNIIAIKAWIFLLGLFAEKFCLLTNNMQE